ncbi:MAG: hypothetical protein JO372_17160 [Solirubrobacterales bacterium]|nr:hypothetical protein [Solirubrobacterales bacterium]
MWAVVLGVLLVIVAATTSHAAVTRVAARQAAGVRLLAAGGQRGAHP